MFKRILSTLAVLVVFCMPFAAQPRHVELTGRFVVLWGDRPSSSDANDPAPRYHLTTDDGNHIRLLLDDDVAAAAGGVNQLNRRRVKVTGQWTTANDQQVLRVLEIELATGDAGEDVSTAVAGSQPWVTVMCKFQDFAAEPKPLSYFQNMYAASFPGFDHHWREQSYDAIDVAGSSASGWFTLPKPRSSYVINNGDYVNLDLLRSDCIAAANPTVDFAGAGGINMMFNADLDCCAWGGSSYMTLDGVSKSFRVTWNPPWAFEDVAVVAHEMGHGFGLPHSQGPLGGSYSNRWDLMSDTWTDCFRLTNPTYGCLGQHMISYHKDLLGWIPAAKRYTLSGGTVTIDLERLAQPQTASHLMAKIPIDATRFYTVEARHQLGYDYRAPGEGVVIHEVDPVRYDPARIVSSGTSGDSGDPGAIWTVGETFADAANGISVKVDKVATNGYTVTMARIIPTKTTLTAEPTMAQPNTPVTLTATVTAGATGTVTFRDNNTKVVIGTAQLSNGTASITSNNRPYGSTTVIAEYEGSATHAKSTSAYAIYHGFYDTVSIGDVSVVEGNSGTTNAVFTLTANVHTNWPYVTYRVIDRTATGTRTGANTAGIGIPSGGNSYTWPSKIEVSGSIGTITKMTVTLNGIAHTYPQDIDILLVGPNGAGVVLMSDAGGMGDVSNLQLVFDDAAPSSLSTALLLAGTYKPTNLYDGESPDSFSSPAPYGPYQPALSAFNGISPNGTWSLYVVDDYTGDSGHIAGGWSINFEIAGADYEGVTGNVSMQNTTTATITVPVKADTLSEGDETFEVHITSSNSNVVDGVGVGTILNDDGTAAAPANLAATAAGWSQVNLTWTAAAGATNYRVYRSSDGVTYSLLGTTTATSFSDGTAQPNKAYLYKARSGADGETPFSNVDLATTVIFTDPSLAAAPVRITHFTELLSAVNAVRTLASLTSLTFSSPAPALGVTVRRQHLLDLRNGLTAARAALSLPPVSYTDETITPGVTRPKIVHITDLRNAVH